MRKLFCMLDNLSVNIFLLHNSHALPLVYNLIRVTVTGIYRATPMRVNPRQRNVKAVYKTYIDVIHFKKTDKKRLYSKDPDG